MNKDCAATGNGLVDLSGKVAIITGGGRGQGAAEARLFASLGAVITDILNPRSGVSHGYASVQRHPGVYRRFTGDWGRYGAVL